MSLIVHPSLHVCEKRDCRHRQRWILRLNGVDMESSRMDGQISLHLLLTARRSNDGAPQLEIMWRGSMTITLRQSALLLSSEPGHFTCNASAPIAEKPPTGIEPVTIRLRSACSANWAKEADDFMPFSMYIIDTNFTIWHSTQSAWKPVLAFTSNLRKDHLCPACSHKATPQSQLASSSNLARGHQLTFAISLPFILLTRIAVEGGGAKDTNRYTKTHNDLGVGGHRFWRYRYALVGLPAFLCAFALNGLEVELGITITLLSRRGVSGLKVSLCEMA